MHATTVHLRVLAGVPCEPVLELWCWHVQGERLHLQDAVVDLLSLLLCLHRHVPPVSDEGMGYAYVQRQYFLNLHKIQHARSTQDDEDDKTPPG